MSVSWYSKAFGNVHFSLQMKLRRDAISVLWHQWYSIQWYSKKFNTWYQAWNLYFVLCKTIVKRNHPYMYALMLTSSIHYFANIKQQDLPNEQCILRQSSKLRYWFYLSTNEFVHAYKWYDLQKHFHLHYTSIINPVFLAYRQHRPSYQQNRENDIEYEAGIITSV